MFGNANSNGIVGCRQIVGNVVASSSHYADGQDDGSRSGTAVEQIVNYFNPRCERVSHKQKHALGVVTVFQAIDFFYGNMV